MTADVPLRWQRKHEVTEFVPEDAEWYLFPKDRDAPHRVRVRFVSDRLNSEWPVLCIEIGRETTKDDIEVSWSAIKQLARELDKLRGPWQNPVPGWSGGRDTFYAWCLDGRKAGYTWKEIAALVNAAIKRELVNAADRDPHISVRPVLEWCLYPQSFNKLPAVLDIAEIDDDDPVNGDELKDRVRDWRRPYGLERKRK